MIRVLIADDQAMIRVGIRAILESQDDITVVGEAENGRAEWICTGGPGRTWC
ncbi:hypothetical protein GCM10029992_00240 [Glycomyces albus]